MNDTKKPIPDHSHTKENASTGLKAPLQGVVEPYLDSKCIECGESVKVGNKFCKKTLCRNKNWWRRKLTAEIEDAVRKDERKKIIDKVSSKMNGVMRVMFNFNDYVSNLKEGK